MFNILNKNKKIKNAQGDFWWESVYYVQCKALGLILSTLDKKMTETKPGSPTEVEGNNN